jgi:hypothetical protein
MKKTVSSLFAILMAFISIQVQGQIKFGVRAGMNLARMAIHNIPDGYDLKTFISFQTGGIAEYSINEVFALESGVLINGKGFKMEDKESSSGMTLKSTLTMTPVYLEIPVNASCKVNIGKAYLLFFAGPYLGIGLAGKVKLAFEATGLPNGVTLQSLGLDNATEELSYGTSEDNDLKRTDLGITMGAGVGIKRFQIRGQYGLGFSNLIPAGQSDDYAKNRVIGISIVYMFGKKPVKFKE